MDIKVSLNKYLLVCVIGFGLGGLLWGWVLYSELPDLKFPFHFMAIIIMGLFGGISLVWFNKSVRNISKSVVAGFLGWGVGFVGSSVVTYFSYFYGVFLLSVVSLRAEVLNKYLNLEPGIEIGNFWLSFLFIGGIIGLFYALFLKTKIWSLIWRGGIGLGLASLISPVIGNLIGNVVNSLLISYLVTFSLIGIISGLFLSWGVYKCKA